MNKSIDVEYSVVTVERFWLIEGLLRDSESLSRHFTGFPAGQTEQHSTHCVKISPSDFISLRDILPDECISAVVWP